MELIFASDPIGNAGFKSITCQFIPFLQRITFSNTKLTSDGVKQLGRINNKVLEYF